MKYDILHDFRSQLENENLAPNTRKQYYAFVKKVLGGLDWQGVDGIDPAEVQAAIARLKTANDVSAARNGLLLFCKYYPALHMSLPTGKELHKRNCAKRKWQPLDIDETKHKINALHSAEERLAYRIMLATGMRVSEVAALTPDDITMLEVTADDSSDGRQILFELQHTKKGGADVAYTADPYLLERLSAYLVDKPVDKPLFPACQTLKNRANELGLGCHDLRRIYAREQYAEASATLDRAEAMDAVRDKLRHENEHTTRRYLRRKIVK